MDSKTRVWLTRLPWWLYLVLRELPESGEAYLAEMLMPYMFGCMSILAPPLALLVVPEWRNGWAIAVLVGVVSYFLVGVLTFFAFPSRSYGAWQERGAW